jgi:hypothetical protein
MTLFGRVAVASTLTMGSCFVSPAERFVHAAAPSVPATIGWIELVASPARKDQVTIVGHVYAPTSSTGRFALIVSRAGKGGTTNTSQSGAFDVAAGENKKLSATSVNIMPDAALTIELKLFSNDKEVFSAVMKPVAQKDPRDI